MIPLIVLILYIKKSNFKKNEMKLVCDMIDSYTGEIKQKDFINGSPIKDIVGYLKRNTKREIITNSTGTHELWKKPHFEVHFSIFDNLEYDKAFLKETGVDYLSFLYWGECRVEFDNVNEAGKFIKKALLATNRIED